jgi:heparosan-N-sulfate-glucuronate 5-epimerase
VKGNEFTFGFGSRAEGSWLRLTRDLAVDLKKGLAAAKSNRRPRRLSMRVAALRLLGEGLVANVSLSEEEHLGMFFDAADWFLNNQVRCLNQQQKIPDSYC